MNDYVELKHEVFVESNQANWEEVDGVRRWTKEYQAELDKLDKELLVLKRELWPGHAVQCDRSKMKSDFKKETKKKKR